MRKQLNEDEAMGIVGIIPVARLNHKPINYKKHETTRDGITEYKTKIQFKDNSILVAVYHQRQEDIRETKNLNDLTWIPSWYEYCYDNKEQER